METRGRIHYHHHTPNPHLVHMKDVRWDVGQMLTPPKSKSPWEAMTSGSTGGWASFASPTAKGAGKYIGPLGTALAGMIPIVGPFISAGMGAAGTMGAGSGFQGTDKGWNNILPTLSGALSGFGVGSLGQGMSSGIQSMFGGMPSGASSTWTAGQTGANAGTWGKGLLGNFGSGFGQGVSNYMSTAAAPFQNMGMNISKMLGGLTSGGGTAKTTATTVGKNTAYTIPGYGQSLTGTASPGSTSTVNAAANMLGAQGANTPTDTSWGQNMLDYFLKPENLSGLALMGASALPRNAEYQSPALMGEATARLLGGQGISEVGIKGRGELMKIMNRSPEYGMQAMDPWLTTASTKLDETYDEARKNLTKKFKGYGAEDSREFMSEMNKLETDRARERSSLQYEAQQREYVRVQNQLYDAIKTSLSLDDNTMQELLGLTQLSIEEAGLRYGIEAADIKSLREALGLGGAAMLNLGSPTYTNSSSYTI